MTFTDIFKNSFMEQFSQVEVDAKQILITLIITACMALFVFFIYMLTTRKGFYAKSFNISLVAMAIITASIILAVQSSVVISLGMVGALSIVRFRTAVKDPRDTAYIFWSIAIGICCGVADYTVGVPLHISQWTRCSSWHLGNDRFVYLLVLSQPYT